MIVPWQDKRDFRRILWEENCESMDGSCGLPAVSLWDNVSAPILHLWCKGAALLLAQLFESLYWRFCRPLLWYTVGIPMLYYRYRYAVPLVPGCFASLVPPFQFVYRQYQGEFSDEMQQDSSMRVWGWCEGREFTLTLTLTTETTIDRAFQANCEGVRVRKEKKLFLLYRYLNGENPPSKAMGYPYHCRKLHRAEYNNEYLTGIMGDTMTRSEETSGIKELEKFHSLMNRKRRASGGTL